jgi:hypothetical protein
LQCGGSLVEPAGRWCGRIAQLVEQLTLNQRAQGSSPCAPTNDLIAIAAEIASLLPERRAGRDVILLVRRLAVAV